MLSSTWMQRWPRHMVDAVVSFCMLHGAFNFGIRTEVSVTLRFYAVFAGLTLLMAVIGQRVLAPKDVPKDVPKGVPTD